jgi:hypothetical protein
MLAWLSGRERAREQATIKVPEPNVSVDAPEFKMGNRHFQLVAQSNCYEFRNLP